MGGVEFGVGELWKSLEGFLGDGISSGANGKSDKDFAEVKVVGLEIGDAVFDVEDGGENGGSNEVDGIGDAIDGF